MTKSGAAAAEGCFKLGPQEDGSVVILLPDEAHRRTAQRAIEKQIKNAGAAIGTVGALDDGEDHFITGVRQRLERVQAILNASRAPSSQMDGTPMGEALKAAATSESGGIEWDASVPEPRPAIGQIVRWPTGQAESIARISGYDAQANAFAAASDATEFSGIIPSKFVAGEWWLLSMLLEYNEQPIPEIGAEGSIEQDAVANAAADASALLEGEQAPAQPVAEEAPAASSNGNGKKPSAKKPSVQAQRNARSNGVRSASPVRPAPKPSAAKKGGRK